MVDPSVRPILTLAGRDNISYNTQKHVTYKYICCYYYKQYTCCAVCTKCSWVLSLVQHKIALLSLTTHMMLPQASHSFSTNITAYICNS